MKNLVLVSCLGLAMSTFPTEIYGQDHDHSKMNEGREHKMEMNRKYGVSAKFQGQLSDVLRASMLLNDAFMFDDANRVRSAALDVKKTITNVDMVFVENEAHMDWMENLKILYSTLEELRTSSSISDQRLAFSEYSNALYKSVKAFGVDTPAFYNYCPMALDKKGANWLSSNEEIENPYMGSKMANCGVVKEKIE